MEQGRFHRERAMVAAITNQKGGVGKTTMTQMLALGAAERGRRVLVIDLDGQGNLSQDMSGDYAISKRRGGAEKLFEVQGFPLDEIVHTQVPGIDLLHGHEHLDVMDQKRHETLAFSRQMRDRIHDLPYDLVLIDTPPSVGVRHVGPLFWADWVLIPMEPDGRAVEGMRRVLNMVKEVQRNNPALRSWLVFNRLERDKDQEAIVEVVKAEFGSKVIAVQKARRTVRASLQRTPPRPVWKDPKATPEVKASWKAMVDALLVNL